MNFRVHAGNTSLTILTMITEGHLSGIENDETECHLAQGNSYQAGDVNLNDYCEYACHFFSTICIKDWLMWLNLCRDLDITS